MGRVMVQVITPCHEASGMHGCPGSWQRPPWGWPWVIRPELHRKNNLALPGPGVLCGDAKDRAVLRRRNLRAACVEPPFRSDGLADPWGSFFEGAGFQSPLLALPAGAARPFIDRGLFQRLARIREFLMRLLPPGALFPQGVLRFLRPLGGERRGQCVDLFGGLFESILRTFFEREG